MIYNYGLEHFSNPSPVKRVNAFSDCDHFFFLLFWKSQQLKEAVQIHFLILNTSAIGVMELISSTLRRYKRKEKIRSGLDES